MNPLEIARVVFEEGWNRQEFTNVKRLLADEFQLHVGGATLGTNSDEFESIVGNWHAAFAGLHFAVHSITADGHIVAVRATLHGTHEGPWGELQATGRSIAVEHAFFLRVEDDLVVEVWEIFDRTSLEAQLAGDQVT